jgi:hypothetical protein
VERVVLIASLRLPLFEGPLHLAREADFVERGGDE